MNVKAKSWTYVLSVGVIVAMMGICACNAIPDLNNSPNITFKSIKFAKGKNTFTDTIFISVDFTDGDGNLGLSSSDTSGQFALRVNGKINLNHYNFIVTPEVKYPKEPEANWRAAFLCPDPPCANNYNGRFPPLFTNAGEQQPIKGNIVYNIPSLSYPYDSLIRFNVYIQDKSLNKSNTILTDSVLIK
jgi:hypothetical protein